MARIQYIISATICLSIAYLAFRLLFDRTANFRQQRIFLILSLAVSMVMPLAGFRIDLAGMFEKQPLSMQVVRVPVPGNMSVLPSAGHKDFSVYAYAAAWIYISIAVALIAAILLHLINILRIYHLSQKSQCGNRIILNSSKIENPFSFFHWIFIPSNIYDPEERESIITHESIHASQYHSLDNILVELLAAVMWFNPLVWMMKKTFHLVHEYLADEGTLRCGIDRLRYQTLLLNRVAEEKLICLSSSFNQTLKKRMIMMTKSKIYSRDRFRILALVPLSAVLLLIVSLLNGLFPQNAKAENPEREKSVTLNQLSVARLSGQQDTLRKHTVRVNKSSGKVRIINDVVKIKSSDSARIIVDRNAKDTMIYLIDSKIQNDIGTIKPDSIVTVNIIADSMIYTKKNNTVVVRLKHPMKIEKKVVVEPVAGEHEVVVEPVEGERGVVVEPVEGEHGIVAEPVEVDHEAVVVEPARIGHEQIEVEPGRISFPEDVIYYIDGRKASKAEVDKINPDNIESVSVYKGDGLKEAGVNKKGAGVVKIVTKKP